MKNSNAHTREVCHPQLQPHPLPRRFARRFQALCTCSLLAFLCAAFVVLSSCSSSGGPGISIQIIPETASVDQGQTLAFSATLANDLRNQGVTWALSGSNCSGSGCGTLSNSTTSAVTYTAPSGLSGSLTITLTATSVANTSATKTATITVEPALAFTTTTPLPNGSNGVPYSQTIVATGGVTPLNYSLASGSGALPAGLQLNSSGVINGRPSGPVTSQPNPSTFTIQVTDSSTTPVSLTQSYSIYISPAPTLQITATSLPSGFANDTYGASISTTGGVTPFTWALLNGTLPPGVSLNPSTGQLAGVVPKGTTAGLFTFTAQVTDSTLPTSQVQQKQLSIGIQQPQPLSISPSSLPTGKTAAAYSTAFNASGGIPPYSWTILSGQLPQGLVFTPSSGTIAGTPILVGSSTFQVQVTDSEAQPVSTSATYSLSIVAGSNNNSLISGQYTFLFKGFDKDGAVAMGGSFIADGTGKITGGAVDSNRVSGPVNRATLTGSYSVGTNGTGTLELIATNPLTAVTLTSDYDLVLDSHGSVRFFEDNSTSTNTDIKKTHGSGIMRPISGSFAAGSFSGNYAFVFTGADSTGARTALGAVIHADGVSNLGTGGGAPNGDYNEATSPNLFASQLQVAGTFTFDSGTHGAATLTFELPGKSAYTLNYSYDFVSASDIMFVGIDPVDATHPALSGEMILQSPNTPFNSSALNTSVATGTGLDKTNASVLAGLLSVPQTPQAAGCISGLANCVTLAYDENDGGTVTPASTPLIGNFQISGNGRVAFSFSTQSNGQLTPVSNSRIAVAYLIGPSQGLTLGSDAAVTTGLLDQQETGVTFSDSLVQGGYTLSTPFAPETSAVDLIGEVAANGSGALLDDGSANGVTPFTLNEFTPPVTPNLGLPLNATYGSISAAGRGTMSTNSPTGFPTNLVFYVVSPSAFRAISTDTGTQHPEVIFFDH